MVLNYVETTLKFKATSLKAIHRIHRSQFNKPVTAVSPSGELSSYNTKMQFTLSSNLDLTFDFQITDQIKKNLQEFLRRRPKS